MWDDVKRASREGILLGVKYGLAVVLILLAVSWVVGDYTLVRQRAANGQQAFEFLVQQQQQRQAAPAPAPETAAPAPDVKEEK